MLGRTRRNRDDLALEWINWMRFQFLIKQKWTSGSAGLAGNRSELNPMQHRHRITDFKPHGWRRLDDAGHYPWFMYVSCWYTSIGGTTGAPVFWFFGPLAINNYGDRLLFALTVQPVRPAAVFIIRLSVCRSNGKVNVWSFVRTDSPCPPPFELLHFKSN